MALFFDASWFRDQLKRCGLSQDDLARVAGWSSDDIKLVFKDQMEVTASQVQLIAALLNQPAVEVANRCGISTPVVDDEGLQEQIRKLEARVQTLEVALAHFVATYGSMPSSEGSDA